MGRWGDVAGCVGDVSCMSSSVTTMIMIMKTLRRWDVASLPPSLPVLRPAASQAAPTSAASASAAAAAYNSSSSSSLLHALHRFGSGNGVGGDVGVDGGETPRAAAAAATAAT
mmetsp:Transcript_9082/g.19480  ORF Transcript_9082/g.19480 Transcript_9082/m.19480 type:complete len:113 (-) Transcript_9082:249-587(-)